jgi:integrase
MTGKITVDFLKTLKPRERPYDVRDSGLPGFLVRVQPSGHRAFYVSYRKPGGGQTRAKVGDVAIMPLPKARKKARAILANLTLGEDPQEAKRKAKAASLKDFLENLYEPWTIANRKSGKHTVERIYRAFKPLLSKRLHELTPWAIEKWRGERRKQRHRGKQVSNVTLNRDTATLRAALSMAVRWGVLEENPLKGLQRLPERDRKTIVRYLSDKEERALWAALDAREANIREARASHNKWLKDRGYPTRQDLSRCAFADYLKPMVILSLNTGLRRGELFHLEWSDVNLDRRVLTVRAAVAKSGKFRHVPLNGAAFDALRGWRAQTPSKTLVFTGPNGRPFDNVNSAWRSVLEAAKLRKKKGETGKDIKPFRWHDMRHHFASKLAMAGVNLAVVKELLGHSSYEMVTRYAHISPESQAAAVAKLEVNNIVPFPSEPAAEGEMG